MTSANNKITPLISICIPTYNRSTCLRQALQSIVAQSTFRNSELIEIVICDNFSSDETHKVASEYTAQYPSKITYFKNKENVGAETNCAVAMMHGKGEYLKLYNDYLFSVDGFLDDLVNVLNAVKDEKPVVLLTNGNVTSNTTLKVCNTLDELVGSASYYITWIASIGFWKTDFSEMKDYLNYISNIATHLPQTYYLLDNFCKGKRAIVLTKNYFLIINPGKKSGYNVAEVFGKNYLHILKKYLSLKLLSEEVFQKEKRDVLLKYIIPNYFDKSNNLTKNGFFKYLIDYANDEYFYMEIENLIINR